eukprot:TRINITY_DN62309_c0_g2_i1.p2 TRINITY_DN62309_c0_g2~~TRINITY_DN62309_c0_g2_i1.p2  ORF type:complete len:242 (+),score=26.74 TRINITY_DN62309_c0_g2_i1:40-765(+)
MFALLLFVLIALVGALTPPVYDPTMSATLAVCNGFQWIKTDVPACGKDDGGYEIQGPSAIHAYFNGNSTYVNVFASGITNSADRGEYTVITNEEGSVLYRNKAPHNCVYGTKTPFGTTAGRQSVLVLQNQQQHFVGYTTINGQKAQGWMQNTTWDELVRFGVCYGNYTVAARNTASTVVWWPVPFRRTGLYDTPLQVTMLNSVQSLDNAYPIYYSLITNCSVAAFGPTGTKPDLYMPECPE